MHHRLLLGFSHSLPTGEIEHKFVLAVGDDL